MTIAAQRPLKIAQVRDVVNVARNITAALSQAGHTVDLLLLKESNERRLWRKALGLPGRLPEVLRLNQRIRAGHYDIVHMHVANCGWMATLGGYPYFIHCHGSELHQGLHQIGRRELVQHTLRHAIHAFYVSPDLEEYVRPYRLDATLLPNPVDTDLFAPAGPGGVTSGTARVLIAAPLTVNKGPELVYEAVRLARQELGEGEIEVAALDVGKDMSIYQHLRHLPGITYLGRRPHHEMAMLYQEYDIIMGQARAGALGMMELESMACGRPVICFCDAPAYARHYAEPPAVYSAPTAEGLAQHLITLARSREQRLEGGRRARVWISRFHSFEAVAGQLESCYRRYLGTR